MESDMASQARKADDPCRRHNLEFVVPAGRATHLGSQTRHCVFPHDYHSSATARTQWTSLHAEHQGCQLQIHPSLVTTPEHHAPRCASLSPSSPSSRPSPP